MAKSFHTTIDEGYFEVDHKGLKVVLDLPEMFQEIKGLTEDKEALIAWMEKHDIVLPVVQCAIQKRIIDLRAIARPAVKSYKDVNGYDSAKEKIVFIDCYHCDDRNLQISKKITEDKAGAQERLDNAEWTVIKRPGASKATETAQNAAVETLIKNIQMMLEMGLEIEAIKPKLAEKHDKKVVALAMNVIEEYLND